jgi:hypothetical protein
MNAKAVITALRPLEGHHILTLTSEGHGFVHGQPCHRVQHLPPDQRQPGQGNVILWDGKFTQEGLQTGGTFRAKDIRSIWWGYDYTIARIYTHDSTKISIMRMWKLSRDQS